MEKLNLMWLLDPITPEEFFKKYFETSPLWVSRDSQYYNKFVNAESVSAFLSDFQNSPFLNLKLVHATSRINELDYVTFSKSANAHVKTGIRLSSVANFFLREKTHIVVDNLNRFLYWARDLSNHINSILHCSSQCVLRVIPEESPAFKPAYEVYDQFIMQVSGRQIIRVFSSPLKNPLSFQAARPLVINQLDLLLKAELTPGDLLYVPRGFVVELLSSDTSGAQVLVNVYNTSWAKVISDLIGSFADEVGSMREGYAVADLKSSVKKEHTLEYIKTEIISKIMAHNFGLPQAQPPVSNRIMIANDIIKAL